MDKHPETAFNIIMNYVNEHPASPLEECLCLFYDPNSVLNAYNNTHYSKSTASEYKKSIRIIYLRIDTTSGAIIDIDFYNHVYLF